MVINLFNDRDPGYTIYMFATMQIKFNFYIDVWREIAY